MKKNKTFDRILLSLVGFIGVYFLIRLIDFSKIVSYFPVHVTGDIPSYMANLFFLNNYGLYEIVPHWFNGMMLFLRYPPGWHYFTLPIYYLTKNITLATYISVVLIFSLILLAIYKLGKSQGISPIRRVAFFLLMFGNAIAIGNFLRLGRAPELFGWLWFIITTSLILWYKDRRIDSKFLWIIPTYAILILSHSPLAVFFHSLLLLPMLFLIKNNLRERVIVATSTIMGLVLSAFWWLPFIIDNLRNRALSNTHFGARMLGLEEQPTLNFVLNNLATSAIIIFLWLSFYVYWQHRNKSKRELLFFSPILLLSALLFFRATFVLPIINAVYPDVQVIGYLFFALYFLFKTPLRKNAQKIFLFIIAIFILSNITVSAVHTPWFPTYTDIEYKTFDLIPLIKGKFLMLTSPYDTSYPNAYYAYAAVFHNTYSVFGMGTEGLMPRYYTPIREINRLAKEGDCQNLKELSQKIQLTEIITYDELCISLKKCGLEEVKTNEPACLYRIN